MPSVLVGAALGGAEQVAELQVGGAAGLGPRFGVELGRRLDHRFADGRQVAALLVLGQAVADRRLAGQLHLARRRVERRQVGAGPFEAGDRGRVVAAAAAGGGEASRRGEGDRERARASAAHPRSRDRVELDGRLERSVAARAETPPVWTAEMPPVRAGARRLRAAAVGGAALPAAAVRSAADREDFDPFGELELRAPGRGSRRGGGGCRSRGRRRRRSRPSGRAARGWFWTGSAQSARRVIGAQLASHLRARRRAARGRRRGRCSGRSR